MGPSPHPAVSDITITQEGVQKPLCHLNPHKVTGPDQVSPRLHKETAKQISPALTLVFQAIGHQVLHIVCVQSESWLSNHGGGVWPHSAVVSIEVYCAAPCRRPPPWLDNQLSDWTHTMCSTWWPIISCHNCFFRSPPGHCLGTSLVPTFQ
jgi:hypothetical protein